MKAEGYALPKYTKVNIGVFRVVRSSTRPHRLRHSRNNESKPLLVVVMVEKSKQTLSSKY